VTIYRRKEIENFLLVPSAINRGSERKVIDQMKRTGRELVWASDAEKILEDLSLRCSAAVPKERIAARIRRPADLSGQFTDQRRGPAAGRQLRQAAGWSALLKVVLPEVWL